VGVERPETLAALEAVRDGLALATSRVGADEIELKAERDLVTGADRAVEASIRAALEPLQIQVVGEEEGGEAAASYWLVDPICGTRNYASGIPLWCVNAALVEDDELVAAVIGDGSTGEVYAAERGRGAWADDGRRLQATDESETVVIEDSHVNPDEERRERAVTGTAAVMRAYRWHIRALSSSLVLPYLAAGRVSGYVLFSASALHVGAGCLLAAEAGATVTDIDGRPWTIQSDSVLAAATPELHRELLELSA